MSWGKFSLIVFVLYAGYYLVMILIDIAKGSSTAQLKGSAEELEISGLDASSSQLFEEEDTAGLQSYTSDESDALEYDSTHSFQSEADQPQYADMESEVLKPTPFDAFLTETTLVGNETAGAETVVQAFNKSKPVENAAALMQSVESQGLTLKELEEKLKANAIIATRKLNFG